MSLELVRYAAQEPLFEQSASNAQILSPDLKPRVVFQGEAVEVNRERLFRSAELLSQHALFQLDPHSREFVQETTAETELQEIIERESSLVA